MVKFFFSDQATLDEARRALDDIAAHAETLREAFRAITASHQERPGPFPERQHIGALIGRFLFKYSKMLSDWAVWAQDHVDEWHNTGPAAAVLGEKVQRENAHLAGIENGVLVADQVRAPLIADQRSLSPRGKRS